MSLLDEIQASTSRTGGHCSFPVLLATLDEPDRRDLLAAIADNTIQMTAIVRAMAARNVEISKGTIQRHRDRLCLSCR